MRYLFVVGHPAHVHLFKNVMRTLLGRGHEVFAAAVRKELTTALLEALGIHHAVTLAACMVAAEMSPSQLVVTVLPDTGERYLSPGG